MSQSEARAWWADVEHLRESIERRRAAERPGPPGADRPARDRPARDHAGAQRPVRRHPAPSSQTPADRREAMAALAPGAAPAEGALDPPGRRTVRITGRTVPAPRPLRAPAGAARRPGRGRSAMVAHRPDRIAMWAVVLGFLLIAVAATSSHAATPASPTARPAHAATAPATAREVGPGIAAPAPAGARR